MPLIVVGAIRKRPAEPPRGQRSRPAAMSPLWPQGGRQRRDLACPPARVPFFPVRGNPLVAPPVRIFYSSRVCAAACFWQQMGASRQVMSWVRHGVKFDWHQGPPRPCARRIDRRPGQVSDDVVLAAVVRPDGGLPPLSHRSGPSQVCRFSSRAAASRARLSSDSSSTWRLLCLRVRPALADQRLESDSHGCSSAVHGCLFGAVSSPRPRLTVWRRLFPSLSGGGALLVRPQLRGAGKSSSLHETHSGPGQVPAAAYDCRRDLCGRPSLRCGRLSC